MCVELSVSMAGLLPYDLFLGWSSRSRGTKVADLRFDPCFYLVVLKAWTIFSWVSDGHGPRGPQAQKGSP
jgi:hypothetical protein